MKMQSIFMTKENFDHALNLVEYALGKDPHDPEAQDLKYDILCHLGRDEEAEEYLSKAMRG